MATNNTDQGSGARLTHTTVPWVEAPIPPRYVGLPDSGRNASNHDNYLKILDFIRKHLIDTNQSPGILKARRVLSARC